MLFLAIFAVLVLYAEASCPNLAFNNSCNTGSCDAGGKEASWTIPVLPAKPAVVASDYLVRVQWDGQVVRGIYNQDSAAKCCKVCKVRSLCKFWLFVPNHPNGDSNICFMYPVAPPTCDSGAKNRAGGKCTTPGGGGDPHFLGAQGTRFDFSGMPGKSFCLLTDKNIHINMKMTGYLDKRTESATVFKNGQAVRSWIRELGFLWKQGKEMYSLKLVARSTGQVERGSGYLEFAEYNGERLPTFSLGKKVVSQGGLSLKLEAYEKKGSMDVDYYSLKINGLLEMDVRVRVAHPLLRRAEDAEAHFDIGIKHISASSIIHGVLGQTFREGRAERAEQFNKISAMLHADIVADGASGKGFLDGEPNDYLSSDVLAADCRYTGFNGHVLPTSVASE